MSFSFLFRPTGFPFSVSETCFSVSTVSGFRVCGQTVFSFPVISVISVSGPKRVFWFLQTDSPASPHGFLVSANVFVRFPRMVFRFSGSSVRPHGFSSFSVVPWVPNVTIPNVTIPNVSKCHERYETINNFVV